MLTEKNDHRWQERFLWCLLVGYLIWARGSEFVACNDLRTKVSASPIWNLSRAADVHGQAFKDVSFATGAMIADGARSFEKNFPDKEHTNKDVVGSAMAIGYIFGVADNFNGYMFCIPENTMSVTLLATIDTYIATDPKFVGFKGGPLVRDGLTKSFPCK